MTLERKKYLASVSKEERAIRRAIIRQKAILYTCKKELNDEYAMFSDLDYLYRSINTCNESIKALKKQLPANKEQYLHWVDYCPNCLEKISNEANYCQNCGRQLFQYVCPICKVSTEFRQDYCPNCGQKLR